MRTNSVTPGSVVVGYSGERDAEHALTWAAEQASLENRTLVVVHVRESEEGHAVLVAAAAQVSARYPELDVETRLVSGSPNQVLTELSELAQLVVVGSRGRGRLATALLGSVSVNVSNSSSCPVVVVRPFHRGKVRNGVLVGTDCTRESRSTLEFAYREASLRRLPLTVLYAVPGLGADRVLDSLQHTDGRYVDHQRELAETVAGMGEKFPDVRVRTVLGSEDPVRWLISQSSSMDLVVVGHHRRAGIVDRLALGSYAPMVVESAACPTAVVFDAPPPGVRDPVR